MIFRWFFDLFRPKIQSVDSLVARVGFDFDALSEWLTFNIWYKKDVKTSDEWKPSWQTLKDRAGDCEDFAVLAYACLKLMGVQEVKIFCLYPIKGSGHCICCFKSKDYWRAFDNGELWGGEEDIHILVGRALKQRNWPDGRYIETDSNGNWVTKNGG